MPTFLKRVFYFTPLLLTATTLFSLPENGEVTAGQADFHSSDGHSLKITTSDKAIINYAKFNIGEGEHVQFIQPSAKSSVLNRITGKEQSKILGKLSGNGRVFLVNPSGVYFGPNASVNTGSFLASTLNIRDEDFLNDKLHFFQEPGSEKATIVNEGMISVSPEGFVALFAPFIENRGSILAHAGKVVLAAAERVILDFSGDGLIQFTVGGDLKQALIENYGQIEAASGAVELSLRTAKDAIKMVVNTDGITPASSIEESNGIIRLVSKSIITADKVLVEGGDGSKIDMQGTIDVSSTDKKGGNAHLLGEHIQLVGAQIDASGATGGGTVLIGGDYQGTGSLRTAQNTVMDNASQIMADAYLMGDGGKVILWADDTALFNGKIFARGGSKAGDGGFVETSGKMNLGVETGYVNTSAPQGQFGNWLLDPATITIATGGAGTIAQGSAPNCATAGAVNISVATMQAAATNVALCAQNAAGSSITVNNAFTMAAGISLSMTAGSTNVGNINLNANITTRGQPLSFVGVAVIGANITLDTTNAGASPVGSNITFSSTVNGTGARTLSLNGGTGGTVTMTGAVGNTTALTSLTATGATITQSSTAKTTGALSYTGTSAINIGGSATTSGGVITMTGPVVASGSPTFDSTNAGGTAAGAAIDFTNTLNGATAVSIRAGTGGTATFSGAVGGTTPLTNLSFVSANLIQIGNNITVTGANPLSFPNPVSLTGTSTITSNNANISFSSTLNAAVAGSQALTLAGGTGAITFSGIVGGTARLGAISATTTNATGVTIGNNITANSFTTTGTTKTTFSLVGTTTIDTSANNGAISFGGTVDGTTAGSQALTLTAGTGAITLSGIVGGTVRLGAISATTTNAAGVTIGNNITANSFTTTGTTKATLSLAGTATIDTSTNNGAISFGGTVDGTTAGAQALTLTAGTGAITLSGIVGGTTSLGAVSATTTNATGVTIGNNITANSFTTTGTTKATLSLTGTTTIDTSTNNGAISFGGTVDGTTAGSQALTLTAGTGAITFSGIVGGTARPGAISATTTNATGVTIGNNITANSFTTTGTTKSVLSLVGTTTINTSANNGAISFGGTVDGTTAGSQALTLTAGTGAITFSGIVGGTVRPGAISATTTNATGVTIGNNITANSFTTTGTTKATLSLAGTATIDTSANNGAISFGGTVDGTTAGAQALTLTAGTGAITLSGIVGGVSRLGAINVMTTNATGVTIGNNITANSFTTTGATKTTLSLVGTTTINTSANNGAISFGGTVDGAAAASQALTLNAGTGSGSNVVFNGVVGGVNPLTNLSFTNANTIQIGANITVTGVSALVFPSPVSLIGTSNITSNNANITFNNTLNGAQALTLTGGSGSTTFSGAVGASAPLTSIAVTAANILQNSTVKSVGTLSYSGSTSIVLAGNITTSGGTIGMTGPVSLNNAAILDTTNAGVVSAGNNISFSSTVAGAQNLTLTGGSGGVVTLTGAVGASVPLTSLTASGIAITQSSTVKTTGAISYTGLTAINIGGNITTTTGGTIGMTGPVVLSGNPTLDSTNGGVFAAGANISFSSTVNGATTLTSQAGTGGVVSFGGAVGGVNALTNLAFTSANTIQIGANITVSGVNPLIFPSPVSLTGTSTITSNNANISFSSTLNAAVAGSQALTLNAGTGAITFSGIVGGTASLGAISATTTNATGVTIGNNITANSFTTTGTTKAVLSLTGTTTIDTSANNGAISFGGTLNGTVAGSQALTLTAGTGAITLSGIVGGVARLGAINVTTTNATGITLGSNITANSFTTAGTTKTTLSLAGATTIDTSANNGAISFGGAINGTAAGAQALTLNAGAGGTVSFSGAVGGVNALSNLSFTNASTIQIGANITVSGVNPLIFPSPVSLTGTSTITSNNANISFNSTLNGAQALTLTAGTGSIVFTGAVGGTNRLTALTISSATNVTANAITASAIVQNAGTGTTTFNGAVDTNGATGIVLTGTNFAINNNITTTNNGPLTINHTGSLVISPSAVLSISGGFNDNGTGGGTTNLSGSITTNGQNLTFSNPVLLVGTTSLSTGAGVGNIVFSSTLDGAQNLSLASGNGNITFTGTVGTTPLGTVTITAANNVTANAFSAVVFNQTAGTGVSTFNGAVNLTGASGFSLVGTNATFNSALNTTSGGPASIQISNNLVLSSSAAFSLDGLFSQTGAGSTQLAGSITTTNDNISFAGPTVFSGTTVLNTGAGAGNILFSSIVDGPGALTMTAGTGNITLSGVGGGLIRLGAVTINSATNVSTLGISAASINQAATATGTSTYAGDLNTNAVAGVALNSSALTVNGNLITTNAGPVSMAHTGVLSLTAGASSSISSTFTESGTGGVNLSGKVTTNNAAISFANAIALTGTTTISSGAGAGLINFSSTINGGQNLTVDSGSGNIIFGNVIGGSTRLNNLTINQAGNVTASGISAATFTQLNGTGTTTLNGAINTNAVGGVNLIGNVFTANNTITTTAAGPVSITNSGLLNITSGGVFSVAGAFTQSNLGSITLSGQITAGGAIAFSGPITLSGTGVLSTAAASQNITLANTINGAGNLTLAAGGGSIALQGAIGSGVRIGALTITSALNVSTLGIVANSIAQQAGTGATTVNGDLDTNGASGISFIVNNLTRTGGLTTTNGGPVTETNSGTLTSVSTGTRIIDGFFLQNGTGPVIYAGTIQTNNQAISFSSPITLNGDVTLNSGAGPGSITLSGTVNGAHALTLVAGSGDILLSAAIGGTTPLTLLTFSSANNITAQSAISAQSITQSAGSGTSIFNGTLSTSTISGIVLTGSAYQFNNTVTTTNAGAFTLSNSAAALFAANFTVDGIFTQSGSGGVSLGASLATTGNNLTIGSPVTLTANSSLSMGVSGSGVLTLSNTVNGAHTLSLIGGSGSIVVSGAIGNTTALTSLAASGNNISLANIGTVGLAGVSGTTTLTAISNLNFTGSIYHAAAQTYSGVVANILGVPLTTFTSSGNGIDFSAVPLFIGANANLTINSANGAITLNTLDAGLNSGRAATLNSGSGTLILDNVGTSGNGEISALNLTGGDIALHGDLFINALSIATSSPHIISLGGDITTVGTPITFPSNVNILRDNVNNVSLTTNGGNITFQGKIDGDLPDVRTLTISSGSGDVFFNNNIGDTANLDSLAILSAHNVTAAAVTARSIAQIAGTGTTNFSGQVTTSSGNGLNLTGSSFTFLSGVDTTTNNGDFSITNSGTLTLNSGVSWNLGGAFNQIGSGPVSLAVSINSDSSLDFESPITLIGTTMIDTSASGQEVLMESTIDGGFDLTIDAGTNTVTVGGAIGSIARIGALVIDSATNITTQPISAASINLTWGTGTFSFTGALNTNALAGITLTGTNIFSTLGTITTSNGGPLTVSTTGTTSGTSGGPTIVSGSITQSSTGTGFIGGTFISLTGNITTVHNIHLNAPLIVDTSAGGGNIIVQGTIDGPFPLTFKAGTGNINLQQAVGAVTPLGVIAINNAANVTTQAISAASIAQLTGTGTTTFNGALSTTGAAGISISTNSVVRGAAVTTTSGGPVAVTISNAGTFTSTAAGTINASGAFTQSGTGAVAFGGTINVSNNNISFAGPITLSSDALFNTGALGGTVTLSGAVQGAHALRTAGGADNVIFGGNIGTSLTPLTSVIIDNGVNVSTQAITAGFIEQGGGTGTSTFNGALTTNTAPGIVLIGTAFAFNAPFTTTAAGTFTLTNSGLAVMSSAATGSVAAAFLQNGSGTTQLSSAIASTTGTIQFSGPVTLSTAASLSTTNQAITLSTLNSSIGTPGSLAVSSGTGDFTINGNVGLSQPVLNLVISSARNVATQAISASSITQSAGTGTTLFNSDLTTTAAGGINLTGSTFTVGGNMTTSGSGPIMIANSGVLTTTVGKTLLGDGGFSQTGAGAVQLASNVSANNNNISFASPMTLLADVIFNSGVSAGDITVATVDGGFELTLTAGRDIFAGVIGGVTRVDTVTVTTVRNNNVSSITATEIVQLAGTGTTTLSGNINTNTAAGINLTGTNFTRSGSIITTGSGSFIVTHTGLVSETTIDTTSIDGSYTALGVGLSAAHNLAGTITARQGISISSPITLLSDLLNTTPIILDTSGGGGNIIISNTINNDSNAPHELIIRSGGGDITLSGAIGALSPIGELAFGNANNINAVAIAADSIQQEVTTTISGTSTFNGVINTSAASGIVLSGPNIIFNDNVSTLNSGPIAVTVSNQLTLANGINVSLDGPFTQSGVGSVLLGGSIATTNDNISFASSVSLTGVSSLDTNSGIGNITFSSIIDGSFPLTMSAGLGSVSLQGSIGPSMPLTGLTVSSASSILAGSSVSVAGPIALTTTGALTFNNSVTTSAGGSITLVNGGALTITSPIISAGSLTQTQIGAPTTTLNANLTTNGNIELASNMALTTNAALSTSGGDIIIGGTVNSDATPRQLTLTLGIGNITLSGAVGGVNPLSAFQITSAGNVAVADISASSILQLAGTGLTHFTGTLSTTAMGGVSLTGNQFTVDDVITTTNGGPLLIVHTGVLTMNALPALGSHSLSGPFSESGGGGVSTAMNMTLSDQMATFSDAVTLIGDTAIDSGNDNITFLNSIDGPFCLVLSSGTGDIELDGPIGTSTNLGCLTVTGADILQNSSVISTGAVQETGTITLNGNITTSASNITLTGDVTLVTSVTLSTGAGIGGGTIHVTGAINPDNSNRNFTLQTGTAGVVTLDSGLGTLVSFHDVTINSGTINFNNFGSTNSGATGTTALTAASDLNFTGTSYTDSHQIYTAGGNFNFNAGAPTTVVSNGNPITFVTGTIQLSNLNDLTINSNGGNVTLTDLFGVNRTLDIFAALGGVTVAHIGTVGQPLNAINVTAATLVAPFTTFPPINFTPTAATLIGVNQLDPTTYFSPVIITADNIIFSFSTCPGGNNIIFNSTLDSDGIGNSRNITFDMCGNTLTFNGTVGGTIPLTSITINDDSGVSVNNNMTVGSFLQNTSRVGATSLFNSGLTTTSGNMNITSPNITLNGSFIVAGAMTLNNSGALLATGVNCDLVGAFAQTGTGSSTISGMVQTIDSPISFHGPVILNEDFAASAVNVAGGSITFDNTINGNFELTFTAGSGDITLSGDLGTTLNRLEDVVFVSSRNGSTKSIFASTITQLAGSGTLSLVGTLDTNGSAGINLQGTNFSRNGATTTSNGGNLVLTNSGTVTGTPGNTINLDGAYIQNGSAVNILNIAGTINARTGISFVGPLSLIGPAVFNTSGGGGNIIFNNTIDGAQNVTLNGGAGNVSLLGALGGTTPLASFTLSNMNDFTANAISSSLISQTTATTIAGTATFNGALSTTGVAGIVLSASHIALNNTITTTGGGPLTLTHTNSLTFASGATISLSGAFSESGGGGVSLMGSLTTANQNITFGDVVNLTGSTTLSSGAGAGTIAFSSTLDGSQSLNLTAGTGSITFGGSVGSNSTLGDLTINSVSGITYPSVSTASITQVANSGATTINGPLLTTSLTGISLTGGVFTQNGAITTNNLGGFTISHSGTFTMAAGSAATISGSYIDNLTSIGTVSARGTINAGGSIVFGSSGAITLAAATTLNSGVGNGGIIINGTVNGANNLTLNSNGDLILLSANIGIGTRIGTLTISSPSNFDAQKIRAGTLTQTSGTGTSHFHDTIDVNGASSISLVGSDFTFDSTTAASAGSITISNTGAVIFNSGANVSAATDFKLIGTGPINLSNTITTTNGVIDIDTDVTLLGATVLNSSAGSKAIMFDGFIDGGSALSLISGAGPITIIENIGSNTRLGSFSLSSTGIVLMEGVNAASITQTGSAATTYNDSLNTNTVGGIDLTAAAITLLGNVVTTAAGPIDIANSGLLTIPIGNTISGDGGFSQTGAGAVSLGSGVSTNSTPISFVSPITLTSNVILNSLSSGSGGANITVDTVDGIFSLTFTTGSGDIAAGAIGDITPLSAVIATSVHNNNAHNITAATIQQFAGSGTTTLNGDLTSTSSAGITLIGTNFSRTGQIITLNGGSFTVTNSGLISGTMINTTSIDGFYIQNGAGMTNFAGTITARQGISFLGPIVMLANGTFDSSAGNGPITLSNTIENFDLVTPHQLTINADSGTVVISSPIGASNPLSILKVTGGVVSINNIGTSLAAGLTGALQIPDPLTLVTPNQVIFTGTVVNAKTQTYTAMTSFNMNAGSATTIFSNASPITFTTGTIQLAASTNLTINSVSGTTGGNITTADIHAGAGSLRTLALNAGNAIASPGTVQPGTIGTAGSGQFASVSLTGALTLPNDISAVAITFLPTGSIMVGGNLTTVNTNLSFPTAVTLTGSKVFSSGGGNISFTNTLNGDANDTRSLSLMAGTGDVTFSNAVGGTFRLNGLNIISARNVAATAASASVSVGSILQASGTGTTEFSRSVSTRSSGGIQFTGSNLQFDSTSTLTTLNNGPMLIANTGTFTMAGAATLSGGVTQFGTGPVAFSGSIASDQSVTFAAPVTLTAAPSIDTSSNGQSITFSNTVNGPGALSLTAGAGDIEMNGMIGGTVPLGAMTIVSADDIDLQPLTASSLTFTTFTGTANYQSVTTTGASGVSFTGNNFIRNGSFIVGGGGSFTVTNSGFVRALDTTSSTSVDGSFTQNGTGPFELSGSMTVGSNISFASAMILTGDALLTTTGNGTITFSSLIDGNQDLTLTAGSGTINLNGGIGTTNRIAALTINSAGNVSAQAIRSASITQTAGSGTTTFNSDLDTNDTVGIVLSGTNFVRGANWTTTNSGPITIIIPLGGSFTSTAGGTINSAGAFRQLGSGSVLLSRTINTTDKNILFSGPVSLAATTNLNTSGLGSGDITFSNTLNGATNLTLASGFGNISMQGAVGGTARLATVTVSSANNVGFQSLTAAAFSQLSGSGTTTLNGPTNINTAAGISINGTGVALNGTLTTTNSGALTINNSGTLNVAATCSISSDFIQAGTGSTALSGAITSTSGQISFSGAVLTSGTPQLTTTSQPILFSSTLDGVSAGTGNLTLNSGAAGDITFNGAIGATNSLGALLISNVRNVSMQSINAGAITQSAGIGTTSILGSISTNNTSGINLVGNIFTINGSIITTSGGPMNVNHSGLLTLIPGLSTLIDGPFTESGTAAVSMSGLLHTNSADITFNQPITLLNPTTLNSDGSGDITLSSAVDGATDLILDAGTNNILALAAIGGITPINNLIIVNANNATFTVINAQTITQLAGTGTTTFNGAVATSLLNGINLTGSSFALNTPVTTTGGGGVVINNSGSLSIASTAPLSLTGSFSQTGTGSVLLSGNITTDNDSINFSGPVTLGNAVALMTNTATGSVSFLNTLDGTQNLNIGVGSGSITFSQPVGGSVALGSLTVTSAANFNSQAISASTINLSGILNLATMGALSTTGASGIVLVGNAFAFTQDITTVNSGPLTITNTESLTFSPAHTVTLDGIFNQNGSGLVSAGGILATNNQTVNFSSTILLNGDYSINTGTIGANATFADDLNGPFNLTIATGLGNVVCQKAIGNGEALQNITITAHDITLNGVGTAATGVSGTMSLTASDLINLSNNFYSAGAQVYSGGVGINFTNGALTNLTSFGGPISFISGPIILSSANDLSVMTNNGNFSYTSIAGTTFENILINTGTGVAFMNSINGPHINNVFVNAGQVEFVGPINAVNTNFEALGAIFNAGAPVAINSLNTATFNALNGDVGTVSSPILVNTSNQIFAGAGGKANSLADFNGSSADSTVHEIISNPPCTIIFNGVIIKKCTNPSPTPSKPSATKATLRFPFAVPGFDSSYFNLASDYFFLPYFFDERYVHRDVAMYYRTSGAHFK